MSTNSNIGIENPDGSCSYIYCHWDGYPSNNGKILLEHYKSQRKVKKLISLGGLSALAPEIGEKHDFNSGSETECTFYHRDRGEEIQIDSHPCLDKMDLNEVSIPFFYVYRLDKKWYISTGNNLRRLTKKDCKEIDY